MRRFSKYIRFIVCTLLIYFVIQQVDYGPLKNIYKNIRIQYCIIIFGIIFVQDIIKALKWRILLLVKNIKLSIINIIQVDYASTFLSLFVPSSISLDLFRGYGLSKEVASKNQVASSIVVDRALSLFALLMVAITSAFLFYGTIETPEVAYSSFSILAIFVSTVLILNNKYVIRYFSRYKKLIRKYMILKKLNELRHSINEYKYYRDKLVKVFLLSLLMQICRILVYYFAALALNVDMPFKYFMIFTPIVMFLVMLPISLAGVGLREGGFVFFFSKVGVLPSTAFAISALVSFIIIISILPGGLVLAIKGLALKKKSMTIEETSLIT